MNEIRNCARGSIWRKWDLHFHTPSSYDYKGNGVTNEEIVSTLKQQGIAVVAITDHHLIDVDRIRALQRLAGDELTVLPGIELRSELGGSESVHYIGIFPEDVDLDNLRITVEGKLELTQAKIAERGGDDHIYVEIKQGAAVIHELGGIVSIHAGGKSNSLENVKGIHEEFKNRLKTDLLEKHVDILEMGRARDQSTYNEIVFPATGLRKPMIIASDNHDIRDFRLKTECWIKADPTFKGLKHVLYEPIDRVYIGTTPPLLARAEQNKTKFIDTVSIAKSSGSTLQEKWFDCKLPINPGLVAIIGNKGSGKSALADILALLGDTKLDSKFSFLTDEKFRNPKGNRANEFEAELTWKSQKSTSKTLADAVSEASYESVKYLPQSHLESICNEIPGSGNLGFESELRSVIFSHVKEADRLGTASLDELLGYHNSERQKAIDLLRTELDGEITLLVELEQKATPTFKAKIQAQLDAKKEELKSHHDSKPTEVGKPSEEQTVSEPDSEELQQLDVDIEALELELKAIEDSQSLNSKRLAAAKRLGERVENLQAQVESFRLDSQLDCEQLAINLDEVFEFKVKGDFIRKIRDEYAELREGDSQKLNENIEESVAFSLKTKKLRRQEIQEKLDRPNRLYRQYLAALKSWEKTEVEIIGDEDTPQTITFLENQLDVLKGIKFEVQAQWEKCLSISTKIYSELDELCVVYRDAFRPVHDFSRL